MAGEGRGQRPPSHLRLIQEDSLLTKCISDPSLIDDQLQEFLIERPLTTFPQSASFANLFKRRDSLAEYLFVLLDSTKSPITPELHWGADPTCPPVYYKSNLVYAAVLGRALSISWNICKRIGHNIKEGSDAIYATWPWPVASMTAKETEGYAVDIRETCSRLWEATRVILIKGLFTQEPTPGDRYAVAILFLTASVAIREGLSETTQDVGSDSAVPRFDGRGKGWVWYDGKINSATENKPWGWSDLIEKLEKTQDLPTGNTSGPKMRQVINEANREAHAKKEDGQRKGSEDKLGEKKDFGFLRYPQDTGEYVPIEVLEAFQAARKHIGVNSGTLNVSASRSVENSGQSKLPTSVPAKDITSKDLLSMEPFVRNFYTVSDDILDG